MGWTLNPELERKCLELAGVSPAALAPATPGGSGEKEFQADVVRFAVRNGWRYYHTQNSKRSVKGFPDLTLLRERLLFAELKTEAGELTPEQRDWVEHLRRLGQAVYVWRPRDWKLIAETLQ